MDITVQPPSYAVDLGESIRETEAHRLRARQPGEAPPSAPAQRSVSSASEPLAAPQPAALEEEEDAFGDFADAAATQPWSDFNGHQAQQIDSNMHQPYVNGTSHLTGLNRGSAKPAQPATNGGHVREPGWGLSNGAEQPARPVVAVTTAAAQEDDEDDFGDFADASFDSAPAQAAAALGLHPASSAQSKHAWPAANPDAAGLLSKPWLDSTVSQYHAGNPQHARGPSVESAASTASSVKGPQRIDTTDFSALNGGHFPGVQISPADHWLTVT